VTPAAARAVPDAAVSDVTLSNVPAPAVSQAAQTFDEAGPEAPVAGEALTARADRIAASRIDLFKFSPLL
jgi:hypothetical protein